MSKARTPATVLGLIYFCFLGFLLVSSDHLPDVVATHFDGNGRPNGWMSRSSHLKFTLLLAFAFPFVVAVISLAAHFLPNTLINIPRREYWLAAERREETLAYLFRQSLWFACIAVCFVMGVHYVILRANAQSPAHLSTPMLLGIVAAFLLALGIWSFRLVRHFRKSA